MSSPRPSGESAASRPPSPQSPGTLQSPPAEREKDRLKEADKRRKRGSLLRLIGIKEAEPMLPKQSQDGRPDGNDAQLFLGDQPPEYVKVKAKNVRDSPALSHLFLAQRLDPEPTSAGPLPHPTEDAPKTIWALEMSVDGRYLAAGSQNGTVRVWSVLGSPSDRRKLSTTDSAAVFAPEPVRVFAPEPRTPVLALSWSKNNFILSASADKTIRLWHVDRAECLCMFKHSEMIPSIAFHPSDDRFFVAGSLDAKVRLWSIPDRKVVYWVQMPTMVTAVAFSPDGSMIAAGTNAGACTFFETKGMKEVLRYVVRSTRGKNSRGSRITSITTQWADESHELDVRRSADKPRPYDVLIASTDSRIRLYRMRRSAHSWTIALEKKFKGHCGSESLLRASFGGGGRYVVSGSQDRRTFVWQLGSDAPASCAVPVPETGPVPQSLEYSRHPVESFEATANRATAVLMAPAATQARLVASEDPVYNLCRGGPQQVQQQQQQRLLAGGPPGRPQSVLSPVMRFRQSLFDPPSSVPSRLSSRPSSLYSAQLPQSAYSLQTRPASFYAPTTPATATANATAATTAVASGSESAPALSSSSPTEPAPVHHPAGAIMVCSDDTGAISIFRQDCAHLARSRLGSALSLLLHPYAAAVVQARVPSIRSYLSSSAAGAGVGADERPSRGGSLRGSIRRAMAAGAGSGGAAGHGPGPTGTISFPTLVDWAAATAAASAGRPGGGESPALWSEDEADGGDGPGGGSARGGGGGGESDLMGAMDRVGHIAVSVVKNVAEPGGRAGNDENRRPGREPAPAAAPVVGGGKEPAEGAAGGADILSWRSGVGVR